MSRQVWRGSACEYQADEQAGVAGLSWRVLIFIESKNMDILTLQAEKTSLPTEGMLATTGKKNFF